MPASGAERPRIAVREGSSIRAAHRICRRSCPIRASRRARAAGRGCTYLIGRSWEEGPGNPSDRSPSRRKRARSPLSTGCPGPSLVQPPAQPGPAEQPSRAAPGTRPGQIPASWHSGAGTTDYPGRLAQCWTGKKHTVDRRDVSPSWRPCGLGGSAAGRALFAVVRRRYDRSSPSVRGPHGKVVSERPVCGAVAVHRGSAIAGFRSIRDARPLCAARAFS